MDATAAPRQRRCSRPPHPRRFPPLAAGFGGADRSALGCAAQFFTGVHGSSAGPAGRGDVRRQNTWQFKDPALPPRLARDLLHGRGRRSVPAGTSLTAGCFCSRHLPAS